MTICTISSEQFSCLRSSASPLPVCDQNNKWSGYLSVTEYVLLHTISPALDNYHAGFTSRVGAQATKGQGQDYSARNKDQKLVSHFFEDRIFYRLLIAVPLRMYRKVDQPNWILVSQMLKLVGKWPIANCYFQYRGYGQVSSARNKDQKLVSRF